MEIVEDREINGQRRLVLATGLNSRAFAKSKLTAALTERGIVIGHDGTVAEWRADGTFFDEARDEICVTGPAFPGDSLLSALGKGAAPAWAILQTSLAAIGKAFSEKKIGEAELSAIADAGPGAILVGEDGATLALPPQLYLRCLASHGETAEIQTRSLWTHPDSRTLNATWAFSFMAGTLAYRIVAGTAPFGGQQRLGHRLRQAEAIAFEMRNGFFEPIASVVWAIRPAAAACIDALVSTATATSTDTLASFGPSLDAIIDPAKAAIPESEDFAAAREACAKKIAARAARKAFFRRNRGAFRIGAIAVIAVAVFVGMYVNDLRAKPDTMGLSPAQIVGGYYDAIAALDQEIPRAYGVKGLKTPYDDTVTNFYVTSRVRTNFEGVGIESPARLFATKRYDRGMLYGISRFAVESSFVAGDRAEFNVSFWLWLPMSESAQDQQNAGTVNAEEAPLQVSVYRCVDKLTLEWQKDRWKIAAIDQISRKLTTDNGKKLLEAVREGTAIDLPYAPSAEEIAKEKAAQ